MSRTSLIFTAVVTFAISSAVACFSAAPNGPDRAAIGNESWTARMGWRYVSYVEGDVSLSLSIEPMAKGDDQVYVPNEANWLKGARSSSEKRRSDILSRLKSVRWNRKLSWQEWECPLSLGSPGVVPGSLESTPGGRALEERRLFEPGSKVKHEQAHDLWHEAARMFAEQAKGTVTIFLTEVIPDSVFQAVELPALKKNPNVTLVFK